MTDDPSSREQPSFENHDLEHHKAHCELRACPLCDEPPLLLALDDIALIPHRRSPVRSRSDVSMATPISPRISLKIPVFSSYMDTVTEARMAIAVARYGGIGFVHRLMSIQDQAEEIERVKRALSRVIERPYTISATASLAEYKKEEFRHNVSTLLVADDEGVLQGIISRRDFHRSQGDLTRTVADVMTPLGKLVLSERGASREDINTLFNRFPKPEQIPIVDDDNRILGLISAKNWYSENPDALLDASGNLMVGACIGLSEDYISRTGAALDAGANVIILAIANGYMDMLAKDEPPPQRRPNEEFFFDDFLDATHTLRQEFRDDLDLIVGDVAEYEGAKALFQAGADTVAVGIGAGSICKTRIVTGVGVPSWTSLRSAARAAREEGKYIICDGGIRDPHHLNKALFAGASAVVVGSPLAGTDEAPGEIVPRSDGRKFKVNRGLASDDAKRKQRLVQGYSPNEDDGRVSTYVAPEGIERGLVPHTGAAFDMLRYLVGGLRSSMSYMAARDIEEFWSACDDGYFGRQTSAGFAEGSITVIVDE